MLDYNWTRFSRVVDIAGAYGSFLARLLRRNQRAAGVLFDQPQARASPVWAAALRCIAGACSVSSCVLLFVDAWPVLYCT